MKYRSEEVGYFDGVVVYLFAIVANLAAQIVISIIAMAVATDGDYFQLIAMILLQLAFLAVPVIRYGRKKAVPKLLSPIKKPHPSIALSVILPIISICAYIIPASYFSYMLDKIGYALSTGVALDTAGKMVLGIFVMVILAPCVEELIFRGFLLSGLRKAFNPYVAALLCAIAFSLMHMNPEQTVYQFCLGYVCSLAAIKSGNLLAPVIVHAGSNLIAVLLDTPAGKPFNAAFDFLTRYTWSAALSGVLLFLAGSVLIFFICKLMQKLGNKESEKSVKQTKPESPFEEYDGVNAENSDKAETEKVDKKPDKKTGLVMYLGGLGLCLVLWIFVFAASML